MKTLIFLLLFPQFAIAQEQWFCTTESSQVRGNEILACGIGQGADENDARALAFKHASEEFSRLCNGKCSQYNIEPKRTTCDEVNGVYKCYRLLVYVPRGTEEIKKSVAKNNPFDLFLNRKTSNEISN